MVSGRKTISVEAEHAGKRLDVFLADAGCYASRNAAAKALERSAVSVNGLARAKRYRVSAGDAVDYMSDAPQESQLKPNSIELDIRYEDDDLIVVSKQVGLVCQPCPGHYDDTLVNALLHHCGREHLCNVQGEGDDRLGIVHRLDRDTSGLMLAAKTDDAGLSLMDQIRNRSVDRHYLALVHGAVEEDSGMVDAPLVRHPFERTKMTVSDAAGSREAVTTFKVLARIPAEADGKGYSLLDCKLFTGRTHQIRAHMEYIGHPVVGDATYCAHAPKSDIAQLGLSRQFLHSYRLTFQHPRTGESLFFAEHCAEDLRSALVLFEDKPFSVTDFGNEVRGLLANAPYPRISSV